MRTAHEIVQEIEDKDNAVKKQLKLEGKAFGRIHEDEIGWLINYAHSRKMTVSEAIGKLVKLGRTAEKFVL